MRSQVLACRIFFLTAEAGLELLFCLLLSSLAGYPAPCGGAATCNYISVSTSPCRSSLAHVHVNHLTRRATIRDNLVVQNTCLDSGTARRATCRMAELHVGPLICLARCGVSWRVLIPASHTQAFASQLGCLKQTTPSSPDLSLKIRCVRHSPTTNH